LTDAERLCRNELTGLYREGRELLLQLAYAGQLEAVKQACSPSWQCSNDLLQVQPKIDLA